MQRVLISIAILGSIVLANVFAWWSIQSTPLPAINAAIPADSVLLDWQLLMTVTADENKNWHIPSSLAAYEGRRVTVDGVLFTMPQFIQGTDMEAAVLTPPSRFGCCGLQCSTKPQLMMLCVLSTAMQVPTEKTVVARATGILRFNRAGNAWTMSELENAEVTLVP